MSAFPILDALDRRLNAYREEMADARLRGKVDAARFVELRPAAICVPVADLRRDPDASIGIEHQLLLGEPVSVFARRGGWAWLQCNRDGYVGWTPDANLTDGPLKTSHVVCVPRTFLYPGPDLKLPRAHALSMGSHLLPVGEKTVRGTDYLLLEDGSAVIARHVRRSDVHDSDFVEVAARFLRTPYLWGGSSGFGLDCSGLIELAMRMCGRQVLRDSDMQAATIGNEIDPGSGCSNLVRGDLIFWRGHVAIVEGNGNLLHANGYTMDVTSEPLEQAIERIATLFEEPIGCRRPG